MREMGDGERGGEGERKEEVRGRGWVCPPAATARSASAPFWILLEQG